MATSYTDTVSDGVQVIYAINFPFLDRAHVEVKFDGAVQATSAYTFDSDSQLTLTSAAANGVTVRVGRNTPRTVQTDFVGGYLPEASLDNGYLQMLYMVQEIDDRIDELHP